MSLATTAVALSTLSLAFAEEIAVDGFECGCIDPAIWNTEGTNSSFGVTSNSPHDGAHCLRLIGADLAGNAAVLHTPPFAPVSEASIELYFRDLDFAWSGGGHRGRFAVDLYDDADGWIASIIQRDTFQLSIHFAGHAESFSSQTIAGGPGIWQKLEIAYTSGDPATLSVLLDGVLVHSHAATSAMPDLAHVAILAAGQNTNITDVHVDDIAISGTRRGPIAHWPFDEGSGTVAHDVTGNGHDLDLLLGCDWSTGITGGALDVRLGHAMASPDSALDLNGSYTVAMWVLQHDNSSGLDYAVVGNHRCFTDDDGSWVFYYRAGHGAYQRAWHPGGPAWGTDYGTNGAIYEGYTMEPTWGELQPPVSPNLPLQQWVHFAVTYDDALQIASVFVDGQLVRTGPWTSNVGGAGQPLVVGTDHSLGGTSLCGSNSHFPGELDDLRIYDRALSIEEVFDLSMKPTTGPIAHWTFEEGSGDIAVDVTGNGHDLVRVGGAQWVQGREGQYAIDTGGSDSTGGYFVTDHSPGLALSGSYTVALWARRHDNTTPGLMGTMVAHHYCGAAWDGDGSWLVDWYSNPNTNLQFREYSRGYGHPCMYGNLGAGCSYDWQDLFWGGTGGANLNIGEGEWAHIAFSYDIGSNLASVYCNGVLLRQDLWHNEIGGSTTELTVGTGHRVPGGGLCGSSHFFPGQLDDIRIYDRALSDQEVFDLSSVVATPPPIDFVAFGLHSVSIERGDVFGNVGSLNSASDGWLEGSYETSIHYKVALDGSAYGDTMKVGPYCSVSGDVHANEVDVWYSHGATIQGTVNSPVSLPISDPSPPFPIFTIPDTAPDLVITKEMGTTYLDPGTYGTVETIRNWQPVRLLLTGGTYEFEDLILGFGGHLVCLAPCEIRIKNRLVGTAKNRIGPACGSPHTAGDVDIFVEGANGGAGGALGGPAAVWLGPVTEIQAHVYAPNGTIDIAKPYKTHACGSFIGKWVRIRVQSLVFED